MSTKYRLTAVIMAFFIIVIYLSYTIISYQIIGLGVEKSTDGKYRVTDISAGRWGDGRVLVGDIVTSIDGKIPSSNWTVMNFGLIERASSIELTRELEGGSPRTLLLTVDKGLEGDELILEFAFPSGAVLLFIIFSFYVYRKRKGDRAAVFLILFFLSIGLTYLSAFSSGRLDPIGRIMLSFTMSFIPIFFMHFMDHYVRRYQEQFISKWSAHILHIVAVIISILQISSVLLGIPESSYVSLVLLVYFVIANIMIVYKLIEMYLRHRHDNLKPLFKFTFIGHIIAFVPFLLLFAVPRLFGISIVPAELTAIFLFGLPIVYLYLFTTKQLFDIDFFLYRFLYYTILSFFPTLLITVVITLVMNQITYSWLKWTEIFVTVYLMITLFLFGKEYIDFRLRPKFSKDLYNFQGSLDRFSKRISRVMKRSDLENVLEHEIVSILPVKRVEFIEYNSEYTYSSKSLFKSLPQEMQPSILSALRKYGPHLTIGETVPVPHGICVVIGHKQDIYHLLWLDDKENRTKYNLDEIGWLRTLANYSAIVYENLYLIEGLIENLEVEMKKHQGAAPWVLRLIFNLSENERRRLASDLHDSALQDQLIWYRKLETVLMDYEMTAPLHQELDAIKEGLLDVIHQIRETCNELRPPLLKEMGIVESLEHLFEEAQMRSNFRVEFRAESDDFARELNDEQTLALYRIVQELLRNASKHAKASAIIIELKQSDVILFRYKDNGVGMELTQLNDSFQHMGLSGIKERVRSLEGDISFRSEVGEGVEVFIKLPFDTAVQLRKRDIG